MHAYQHCLGAPRERPRRTHARFHRAVALQLDQDRPVGHGDSSLGTTLDFPCSDRRRFALDQWAPSTGRQAATAIFRRFLDLGSALLLIRELNAQGHRTKSWTTQAGILRAGRPFDKGTLYKILRNRVYLGEAVHKGKSYPGEHEPIVDRPTWDRVHEVLASNARRRANEARARTPAPLRGLMRCTHCSSAMTPTHTRRRGRLYRYYICLGASRRGHDTCPVRSIAASEVEGLVLGQVRRLLASPEQLVARTITAVRRENGTAEDTGHEEGDVIEALGRFEPVWDELYPAEQARILRLLIERIDVAPDGISVTLHAAGIRSLVAELPDQEAPALAASGPLLDAAE